MFEEKKQVGQYIRFGGESAGSFDIFARKLNWKERSDERTDGQTNGLTRSRK